VKKDSQGICFLGAIDMKDFLSHYITEQKGTVTDTDGKIIGEHDGALFYTIGQRHGFRLHTSGDNTSAQYVISKEIDKNIVVVSPTKPSAVAQSFFLSDVVLRMRDSELVASAITVSTRYHQPSVPATISRASGTLLVTITDKSETPSFGQSAVLYVGSICIGGGIIEPVITRS
jgi:tRNA-specific 2-thiouridylase